MLGATSCAILCDMTSSSVCIGDVHSDHSKCSSLLKLCRVECFHQAVNSCAAAHMVDMPRHTVVGVCSVKIWGTLKAPIIHTSDSGHTRAELSGYTVFMCSIVAYDGGWTIFV